jgi:hypothetical protein
MFQVEVDKSKNLLKIRYAQHVGPEDTKAVVEKVSTLLPDLQPGFRLLGTSRWWCASFPTRTKTSA